MYNSPAKNSGDKGRVLNTGKNALHVAILAGTVLIAGCNNTDNEVILNNPDDTVEFRHIGITTNYDDNTITLFNADTMAVTHADIALSGSLPTAVTLSTDNTTAYVSNDGSNDISIIDLLSGTEVGVIGLSGTAPGRSVIATDGYLYVAFNGSSGIAKVDITATTPAEIDMLMPNSEAELSANAVAATADGAFLYASYDEGKGDSGSLLVKFDLNTMEEVASFESQSNIDMEIDENGILYLLPGNQDDAIYRFDTNTDSASDNAELANSANLEMNDLHLYNGKLFATTNADDHSGGVAEISTLFNPNNFTYESGDDNSYNLDLGFDFNFFGTNYNNVTMNSNGTASFNNYTRYVNSDVLNDIIGFSVNNDDLNSSDLFNYSSRVYTNHAVFQWLTNTYYGDENANAFTSFEVILYDNGQARFDYLLSGPDAIYEGEEDENYPYGVGNGEVVVNLRDTIGSPFALQRKSYLWDPATPNTMTEVPFAWEGTGIHFNPAILSGEGGGGYTSGVGITDSHIFMTTLRNYDGDATNNIVVYDRDTMLPLNNTIAVGSGPRAIAIAKLPIE